MNSSNLVLCPFHGCKILPVGQPASQPDDVTYPQCLLNEPSGRTSSNVTTIKNPLIPLRNLGLFKVSLQQQSSRLIRAITIKQDTQQSPNGKCEKFSLLKSWRKSCLFEMGRKVIATYYCFSFSLACEVAVPPLSIITSGSSCQPPAPYVISSVSKTSVAARTSTSPPALHPD